MRFQPWHAVLLCVLAAATGCGDEDGAAPQPATGTVRGAVLDINGAGITDVVVRLNQFQVPGHQTSTGADGRFSFVNVEAGDWNLLYLIPNGYATAQGRSNFRSVSVAPNEVVDVAPFVVEEVPGLVPGPASELVALWGNGQVGTPGERVSYWVESRDAHGNPVPSGAIEWRVESGGGLIEPNSNNPRNAEHTLGYLIGPQPVTATARSIPGSPHVTFTTVAVHRAVWVYGGEYDFYYGYVAPAFSPATIEATTGQTVGWRWSASILHNVVFEDDPGLSSPNQSSGSHLRKFDKAGTFRYRCTYHSASFNQGMVGAVTVMEPGS